MDPTSLVDGPPAKKLRLHAPPSPSPSLTSDLAFDDTDDLYDTPAKPPTLQTPAARRSADISSQSPQPTSAGSIPGLQLFPFNQPGPVSRNMVLVEDGLADADDDIEAEDFYDDPQPTTSTGVPAIVPPISQPAVNGKSTPLARKEQTPPPPVKSPDQAPSVASPENSANKIAGVLQTEPGKEENLTSKTNATEDKTVKAEPDLAPTKNTAGANSNSDEKFLAVADANLGDPEAEWEYDSSAEDTSDAASSSSGSGSTDDEDETDGEEYVLLDPREQARILMQEEGGSDDEGGGRAGKIQQPRTAHEKFEQIVEKPDVQVTLDMDIVELGDAEAVVENSLLIRGKTSGLVRVLETGSVLCLEDRIVIGAVAETLGRVEAPRYSVPFTNAAEIAELGINIGKKIFYVPSHSEYIFTQPLKLLKGSDASNQYDEEVGAEEVEFSDDEAEAEYKRQRKMAKRGGKTADSAPNPRQELGKSPNTARNGHAQSQQEPEYPSEPIKYEDDDDGEELYTPLPRPPNLNEHPIPPKPPIARGGMDRGRGFRGRGECGGRVERGGRGDRGGRAERGGRGRPPTRGGAREQWRGDFQHNNRGQTRQDPQSFRSSSPAENHFHQPHMLSQPPPILQVNTQPPPQPSSFHHHSPTQAMPGQHAGFYPPQAQMNPYWMSSPPMSPHRGGFPPNPPNYPWPPNPGGTLPPGAHINPAFFRNQSPPFPPPIQPPYQQPQYGANYPYPGSFPNQYGMPGRPPVPPPANQGYDPSRPWMS